MKSPREHVEDALREIATLLLAFAPLDAALAGDDVWIIAVLFTIVAVGIFWIAIKLEKARTHVHRD